MASRVTAKAELVEDEGFSLAKVSFGDILTPVGIFLMTFGFGSYFMLIPGSSLSGVALIYGFPVLLLGFALKYAQLEPVECKTTKEAFALRESQMTDNLKQVREDCTRFRCAAAAFPSAARWQSSRLQTGGDRGGAAAHGAPPHNVGAAQRVDEAPSTPSFPIRLYAGMETSSTWKRRWRASSSSAAPPACPRGSARGSRACARRSLMATTRSSSSLRTATR